MTNFVEYQLPAGVELDVLSDQSTFIKASLSEVANAAFLGGIFAVIIIYLFLRNLSHTLIIAAAIPVSIIATFAGMYLGDVSLNIMSLGGLALGVGMMVDNSIVVLESIFRCREEGDGIVAAAVRGTREVGGAVTASTLTTIAVFFPIVFVEGVAGQVFGDLSLAVVFSLLASLAVALWFIPMLASRQMSKDGSSDGMVTKLTGSHILRFRAVESARAVGDRFEQEHGIGTRVKDLALLAVHIPLIIVEVGVRCAALLAAAAIVIGKGMISFGAAVLWPLAAPTKRFILKKRETPYGRMVAGWSERETWWKFQALTGRVWPPILSYNAAAALRESSEAAWNWWWRGAWWHRALRTLPWLLRMALVLVRFVVHAALEPIGKALVLFFVFAALVIVGFLSAAALLIMPLFVALSSIFEVGYGWVAAIYPRMIRWALDYRTVEGKYRGNDNRLIVLGAALALFVGSVFVLLPKLGTELIPQVHQGEFFVDITMPVGTPIASTSRVISRVEDMARSVDGVRDSLVSSTVGAEKSATTASDEGENTGRVTVVLEPMGDLEAAEAQVMEALRDRLSELAQAEVTMSLPTLFTFKTPVELEIRGYNLDRLRDLSYQVRDRLATIEGFEDVESSIQPGNPEVMIIYDRQRLAELGLTPRTVAELIRTKVRGTVATTYREEDLGEGQERRIDVRVQVDEEDKEFVSDLSKLIVNPGQSVPVRLSSVADIQIVEGPSEIRRIGQQRAAVVSANLKGSIWERRRRASTSRCTRCTGLRTSHISWADRTRKCSEA